MREPVIVEELGKVWGRDAVYLDKIEFEGTHTVTLKGEFNGSLCENIKDETDIPYEITFREVLEFKVIELDFYPMQDYSSSFEIIRDSKEIERIENFKNNKLSELHSHYVFYTYDDVIEVIASGYSMKIKKK